MSYIGWRINRSNLFKYKLTIIIGFILIISYFSIELLINIVNRAIQSFLVIGSYNEQNPS